MWIYLLDVSTFDFYLGFIFLSSVYNIQPLKKLTLPFYLKYFFLWLCWILVAACGILQHTSFLVTARGLQSSRSQELQHSGLLGFFVPGVWDFSSRQRSNPCPFHFKADSQPLDHKRSPYFCLIWVAHFRFSS